MHFNCNSPPSWPPNCLPPVRRRLALSELSDVNLRVHAARLIPAVGSRKCPSTGHTAELTMETRKANVGVANVLLAAGGPG